MICNKATKNISQVIKIQQDFYFDLYLNPKQMRISICLLLFVALAASQHLIAQPLCPALYLSTPSGCWSSCTNPKYNQCPDIFPLIYNPSFCAYTNDGRYLNFTFQCQACKTTQIVAVKDGACSCDFLECGLNQTCEYGQCIDNPQDPCLTVKCSAGNICQNGQCVPQVMPCKMLCRTGYICQNGQCVLDKCSLLRCKAGFSCQNGKCLPIDKCVTMKCAFGYVCKHGQCVPNNIDQTCAAVTCMVGYNCVKGRCIKNSINSCADILCIATTTCIDGKCVPLDIAAVGV